MIRTSMILLNWIQLTNKQKIITKPNITKHCLHLQIENCFPLAVNSIEGYEYISSCENTQYIWLEKFSLKSGDR